MQAVTFPRCYEVICEQARRQIAAYYNLTFGSFTGSQWAELDVVYETVLELLKKHLREEPPSDYATKETCRPTTKPNDLGRRNVFYSGSVCGAIDD